MRGAHPLGHQLIQRIGKVASTTAPDRLRSARNLKPLPCEDVFQPVVREVIRKLARNDKSQQPRPGHALVNCHLRLGRRLHLRVVAVVLAASASILSAYVMDPHEVAGKIFHLPAFVRADLLALDTAAGAGPFSHAQLVHLGSYGKVFEVSKIAPSLAPLHAPKFFRWFGALWKVVRIDRLQIHLLGEVQKHLCQVTRRLQTIGARAVVPLAISIQLQLQAKIFNVEIVGTLGLLFGKLNLLVALIYQRGQHGFQRLAVIGKSNKIGFVVHSLIRCKWRVVSYIKL